jgi:hypothetical protein
MEGGGGTPVDKEDTMAADNSYAIDVRSEDPSSTTTTAQRDEGTTTRTAAATTTAPLQHDNESVVVAATADNGNRALVAAPSSSSHSAGTNKMRAWLACGLLVIIVVATLFGIFCDRNGCQWVPPITARP